MTLNPLNSSKKYSDINLAIVLAIIIGICITSAVIIFEIRTERFSAVYINPDTYSNYPETGTVSFVYGINSNELGKTSYTIYIRAGNTLVETKSIELMPHEQFEERKVIQLPEDVVYPVKISVQYVSSYENNEVFFRIRNATDVI